MKNETMKKMLQYNNYLLLLISSLFILSSCTAPVPRRAQVTNRRAITQNLPNAILDQISVEDLRVTADLMARDLVVQSFLYNGKHTPIVSVKPIENKTNLTIDPDIFQKTIRVKLMEKSQGRILFRDEVSHAYTIEERLKQNGTVQMSSTTTTTRRYNPTRIGAPLPTTVTSQTNTTLTEQGEASKRVADTDYFLTGLIYSTTEVARIGANQGMRYFQFQFRLTDAQTNIIMWEKEYSVKRQARFR